MALSLLKSAAVSTGAGVLDLVTEEVDYRSGLVKPFENVSDWVRTGATVGGYALGYLKSGSQLGDIGTTLAVAYEPLLLRSVYHVVAKTLTTGNPPAGSLRLVKAGQGANYGAYIAPPASPAAVPPASRNYRPFVPS